MSPTPYFPLRQPERWPVRMGITYLGRLWRVSPLIVQGWADRGLIGARREGRGYVFDVADVREFVAAAIQVRQLRPGMIVRSPRWAAGTPVRVVDMRLVGTLWQVGVRTADGVLFYPVPCSGDRVVLQVPAGQAGDL